MNFSFLNRLSHWHRQKHSQNLSKKTAEEHPHPITCKIDKFWCDQYGMFLRGWIHHPEATIEKLVIEVGSSKVDINTFITTENRRAFSIYFDCPAGEMIHFTVYVAGKTIRFTPKLPEYILQPEPLEDIFSPFAREINDNNGVVAEIGARRLSSASVDYRVFFPAASQYIGVDVHPGDGVDVVGDAHALHILVGRNAVDAVFSMSVLEHLANPWMHAYAINQALKVGGLVYISTVQSWPPHELPNDFWRFSDEGLKLLFGENNGFEIMRIGMRNPMHLHPRCRDEPYWMLPDQPGFGESFILSRKVRDINMDTLFKVSAGDNDTASHYPSTSKIDWQRHNMESD